MRIFIDARLLTKGKTTGIEAYTHLLVDALLKIDSINEYIFFYNGFRKVPFPDEWRKKNVKVIDKNISNKLLEVSFKFFHWPTIETFSHVDVIYSPHFNLLRTKNPEKRVITFHDCSFAVYPEFFPLRKQLWHWEQECGPQARHAGAVIAVSDFTKETLVRFLGVASEKIYAIHSGVNPFYKVLEKYSEEVLQFRKTHHLESSFLLSVGTFEPRKNYLLTIKIFSELKKKVEFRDLKLVLAGSMGWLTRSILKAIRTSSARDAIMIWETPTDEELRFLYNSASVFLYPSFFEGFGFPPLEAQACGCPVVASNRSSLPEVLQNSALLVDPWRVEEGTLAVEALLKDSEFRELYRARGFENIKRFLWEETAKKLLKIFEIIFNAKRSS